MEATSFRSNANQNAGHSVDEDKMALHIWAGTFALRMYDASVIAGTPEAPASTSYSVEDDVDNQILNEPNFNNFNVSLIISFNIKSEYINY